MVSRAKKRDTPTLKPALTDCLSCKVLMAEVEELKARLEERKVIEQGKWILVKQKGISEEEALNLLRVSARRQQKTICEIAKVLIAGERILSGSFPAGPGAAPDEPKK